MAIISTIHWLKTWILFLFSLKYLFCYGRQFSYSVTTLNLSEVNFVHCHDKENPNCFPRFSDFLEFTGFCNCTRSEDLLGIRVSLCQGINSGLNLERSHVLQISDSCELEARVVIEVLSRHLHSGSPRAHGPLPMHDTHYVFFFVAYSAQYLLRFGPMKHQNSREDLY